MEFAFGLLGIAVGALIQFLFNRRSNHESRALEMKSEAYADYINAVADSAFQSSEALRNVAAAKARICSFGDRDVLESLYRFERTSQQLSDPEAQAEFTALVQEIRKRSIANGTVANGTLNSLLFQDSNEPGKHDLKVTSA